MISKRRAAKIAKKVNDVVFGKHQPDLDIRYVERSPKRILKAGFRTLVPKLHEWYNLPESIRVVLHIRHDWRRGTQDQLASVLAHELLHAQQIIKGELRQDEKGIISYFDQEYWFFYNVNYRQWQVCRRKQFASLFRVPWEAAVETAQEPVAKVVMFELRHDPLKGQQNVA